MARKFTLTSRTGVGQIDFAADLNEEQLAVATAPGGPMLVIAGEKQDALPGPEQA